MGEFARIDAEKTKYLVDKVGFVNDPAPLPREQGEGGKDDTWLGRARRLRQVLDGLLGLLLESAQGLDERRTGRLDDCGGVYASDNNPAAVKRSSWTRSGSTASDRAFSTTATWRRTRTS